MFIGDGAKLVRDAFALAKEKAPAIIFIDELDAIGEEVVLRCEEWHIWYLFFPSARAPRYFFFAWKSCDFQLHQSSNLIVIVTKISVAEPKKSHLQE